MNWYKQSQHSLSRLSQSNTTQQYKGKLNQVARFENDQGEIIEMDARISSTHMIIPGSRIISHVELVFGRDIFISAHSLAQKIKVNPTPDMGSGLKLLNAKSIIGEVVTILKELEEDRGIESLTPEDFEKEL